MLGARDYLFDLLIVLACIPVVFFLKTLDRKALYRISKTFVSFLLASLVLAVVAVVKYPTAYQVDLWRSLVALFYSGPIFVPFAAVIYTAMIRDALSFALWTVGFETEIDQIEITPSRPGPPGPELILPWRAKHKDEIPLSMKPVSHIHKLWVYPVIFIFVMQFLIADR